MKNLKKLLALVVACVMVFGVVASAAVVNFPDVASNAKYAEAVKVLSALNVINGDDKGNFNPDQNVTRAEMAKILCTLIGAGTQGQVDSGFADVTAAHWASGYVKHAKGLGIIAGYNDAEFGPEDNVTYEQAIKLIVAALGYSYMADDKGGYPAGYMMVAADLKLTNKVTITDATAPAKRSDIAILAYNALEANMMERVTYGTEAKYEPVAKNLLNNKLGIYRVEGSVMDTFKNVPTMDEGEIDFDITKVDENTVKALELTDDDNTDDEVTYSLNDIFCQDASAADLAYYPANAYLAENEDGDYEVIAVVAKATKVKEIVFEDLDVLCDEDDTVVDADEVMDIENGVFSYWSNADHDDKRPTVLEVEAGAQMVINNGGSENATTAAILGVIAGTLKVVDRDGDGEYDLFIVKSYDIAVVDSVIASSMTLRLKSGTGVVNTLWLNDAHTSVLRSLILNEDAVENMKELTVTIDGQPAELTDLAKNDVVLIATNGDYNSFNPTFVEIHATRKVVEGKVKTAVEEDLVTIGDEEYEVFPGLSFPAPKEEGKFYLTSTGVIVYTDTVATISNNYAYVYKVGTSSFGDKSLRMLTAAGEDVTYDVADRIAINGVQTTDKKADQKYTGAKMAEIFGGVATDYYVADGDDADEDADLDLTMSPEEIIAALVDGDYDVYDIDDPATLDVDESLNIIKDMKLVAYEVSGTELTELNIATGSATSEEDFGVVSTLTKKWVANTNKFYGSKTLAEGAKIFMIEAGAEFSEWKVVDAAALVDDKAYDVAFYGYNANGTYNVALISSGTMAADTEAAFAYFVEDTESYYGADEEDATKVTFIQGGEKKVMYVLADDNASETVIAAMNLGDVFIYSAADDADVMENVEKIASPIADVDDAMYAGDAYDFDVFEDIFGAGNDYMYTDEDTYEADNAVFAGIIATADTVEGGVKVKMTQDDDIVGSDHVFMIPNTANVVVLNNKVSKNKLYASTLDSIIPSEYVALENGNIDLTDDYTEEAKFYYAIIRLYNDVVVDVYVINHENTMLKFEK